MTRLRRACREFVTVLRTGNVVFDQDNAAFWIRAGREEERRHIYGVHGPAYIATLGKPELTLVGSPR